MKPTIEYGPYLEIWSISPESAREFFGFGPNVECVVLKNAPETEREKERYNPNAKLFGLKVPK